MFPISRIERFFFFFFFFRSHIGSLLYFTRCRFYMKHIGWIFGPVSFHMTKLVSDPKNFTRTSSQPSPVFPKESCPFLDDSSPKASFRPTLALLEKKKKKTPPRSFESGASAEDSGQEMQVHLHRQIQQGGQSRIPAGLLCNLNTVFLLLTLQLSPETDEVVSAVITVLSCKILPEYDRNILLLNL